MQNKPHENLLNFKDSVIKNFHFLELKYGFTRRSIESTPYAQVIIYEKSDFYVLLTFGSPQYEPSMSFGIHGPSKAQDDHGFGISDLLELHSCQDWILSKANSSDNEFDSWISELARILISCGEPLLRGDYSYLKQMKSKRNQCALDWQEEERIKKIRSDIDEAWHLKDYKKVVELYRSISELTDFDRKIISFSIKKV